ncbi:hypothetical protein YC2023_020292 [Brassica napus]
MPSDEDLSHAGMSQESLETFILRHRIPAWLMINHMLRFPNKTLVPCSIPDKMFTITKSRGSGLFLNNARIVSPNICQNQQRCKNRRLMFSENKSCRFLKVM